MSNTQNYPAQSPNSYGSIPMTTVIQHRMSGGNHSNLTTHNPLPSPHQRLGPSPSASCSVGNNFYAQNANVPHPVSVVVNAGGGPGTTGAAGAARLVVRGGAAGVATDSQLQPTDGQLQPTDSQLLPTAPGRRPTLQQQMNVATGPNSGNTTNVPLVSGNGNSLSKLQQLTNGLDQPCNTPPGVNLTPSPNHHPNSKQYNDPAASITPRQPESQFAHATDARPDVRSPVPSQVLLECNAADPHSE